MIRVPLLTEVVSIENKRYKFSIYRKPDGTYLVGGMGRYINCISYSQASHILDACFENWIAEPKN